MLKNKAQIARERVKTTLELPVPWNPAESEFDSALEMSCVHIIYNKDLESAPVSLSILFVSV